MAALDRPRASPAIPLDELVGDRLVVGWRLERMLQNQPRAEAADRLDRVVLVADTGDEILKVAVQPLARAMLAIWRTSSSTYGSTRRLRPIHFPGSRDADRRMVGATSLSSFTEFEEEGSRWPTQCEASSTTT